MKIDAPDHSTILVELSDSDLKELDITYEEMDYQNIETRRVVWTLLDKAARRLGREIHPNENMHIEVLPDGNDGCIMLFHIGEESRRRPAAPLFLYYETDDFDCLADALHAMGKMGKLPDFSLYRCENTFRLQIAKRNRPLILSEFLTPCPDGEDIDVEHWQYIGDQDLFYSLPGKGTQG